MTSIPCPRMRTQTQTLDVMEEGQNLAPPPQDVMERGQNPTPPLEVGANAPRPCWVFTLNNYTEEEAQDAMNWAEANCAYVVFGWELAPTTFIPHVQGYFRLKQKNRIRYLRWTSL